MSGTGTGDYAGVPPLNLNTVTPADVAAAFPPLTTEQSQQVELSFVAIRDATQANLDSRVKLANILANVNATLGIIGRTITIVSLA